MKGFRAFLLRGNVVDLAIAVVVGTAFTAVVTAAVKDLVTPLLAAIGGKPNFAALTFTINKSRFLYGDFINALLSFVIVAAVLYFLVVLPFTKFMERRKAGDAPTDRDCPHCLSAIPLAATRCPILHVGPRLFLVARRGAAHVFKESDATENG